MSCGTDGAVYQCDADGQQLTKVQDCQYGCSVDHCKACAANTTFCSGDDLVSCNANGEIVNPQACQNGCQVNQCNACMPNTNYCSNATAITCGSNGQPAQMTNCAQGCLGGVCNSCTPSTTTCQGDSLVVCNAGGTVQSATNCALGCSTTGTAHCKALVPSYGVPAPSGSFPNLVINDNATLDISGCTSLNVLLTIGTATTAVPAAQLAQINQSSGYPPICVVRYGAITINDPYTLTVVNSASPGHVLSLQAVGDIDLSGKVVFVNAAPGPSRGLSANVAGTNANSKYMAPGAGGGGAVRAGGSGGACVGCGTGGSDVAGSAGGDAVTTIGMLFTGGSAGGNAVMGTTVYGVGGLGGGGLQLVSLTRVSVTSTSVINLNGLGGAGQRSGTGSQLAGGGGAGGTLVVEAPIVNVSAGAIAAANGGGGAGGGSYRDANLLFHHYNGQPGQLSTTRAAGGDVPNMSTGDGGYEANGATLPSINGSPSDSGAATVSGGGGGGSSGFIMLRARAIANVMIAFGAIISPAPTTGVVMAQ
jgi:hypothetical protein